MQADIYLKRIEDIINGNGKDIADQLILAGLFLTVFERFKVFIVERVDGFFATNFRIENGKLNVKRGVEFKKLITDKGDNESGQHANRVFRASVHWFWDLNAIDKEEFEFLEGAYIKRNNIGHELFQVICDPTKEQIYLYDVLKIFELYVKLVRWWVVNVELATDPDMTQEKLDTIDENSIENIETMLLRQIINKALHSNEQWSEILENFRTDSAR